MLNVFGLGKLQVPGVGQCLQVQCDPFWPRKNPNGTCKDGGTWKMMTPLGFKTVHNIYGMFFLEGVDVYVIGHSNVPLFRKTKKHAIKGSRVPSNKVCCESQGRNISLSKTNCFWSNLILLTMTLLQSAASAILDAWQ